MNLALIVLTLYVFASVITGVCAFYVLRWARENNRARRELIVRLSNDPSFVQEIEQLQFVDPGNDVDKAEIARLQTIILAQMQELTAAHAKLLREPISQPSLKGRTGYIKTIAKEVKQATGRTAARGEA